MSTQRPVYFVDLQRQYEELKDEIGAAVGRVFSSAGFILGAEVEAFEREFAEYCGVKHCVGVGSGLDALTFILRGLGLKPGDEVILPGNTFIATALAVTHAGGTPVLVDHDPKTYTMDAACFAAAINARTRAVVPVHLYGRAAEMGRINAIASEHGIAVVEDAAQAHGAVYNGRRCGSLGFAAAFSFYPGKNLGGAGDGGAVVTDSDSLAAWLRQARNYGSTVKYHHEMVGYNSRLDAIQAAVLRVKLRRLDRWNALRRQAAERYCSELTELPIGLPVDVSGESHVHHVFPIRCGRRDDVAKHLQSCGVQTGVHYPIPIHQQPAYRRKCRVPGRMPFTESIATQLLSLPMHPHLTRDDIDRVVQALRTFPGDLAPVGRVSATCQGEVCTTASAPLSETVLLRPAAARPDNGPRAAGTASRH
ncbi:MAG: DegT/DnrJ/EryC1/StrS family aminotransferase [Phycisphaerales bacterium]|nr:MAG: DegT/DnrJ/EryC1/StrS family aminotransferase [Phycisphaerales bacterium]